MTTEIHPTQTKPQESMLGMRERDFYIDCLRTMMIALVILHHTAITYGALGGWYYHELRFSGKLSSVILGLFVTTNQAYFMGFLFLLAGYFTPGSLERKGYARFLSDRFLRLGLPLLFFSLFLGPLTVAMVTAPEGKGFWSSFVWLFSQREFDNGPLWFVQVLLMFSLAYCAWRAWFGAPLTSQRAPRPVPSYGWWLLSAFGVGAAALAIRQVVPVGVTVMGMQVGYFGSYIFLFSMGIAAWRYDWLRQLEWNHARDWITALAEPWVYVLISKASKQRRNRVKQAEVSLLPPVRRYILRRIGGGKSMTNKAITTECVQLSKQNADPIASIRHPIVLRRILAPTDLSPDGKKAVEYAIALAEHFSSEVTILHVYPAPSFSDYPRPTDGESVANIFRENAQNALDSFRSGIKQEYPRIDGLLRCGKPEEEIVGAAKDLEVDLIVLSTHNYQWFSRLIHGSDAEGVLRHAPCPMLVVRKEEHDFIDAN